MFGTQTWDTSMHEYLRLRVRSSGDNMRYFVNIQTDGPGKSRFSLSRGRGGLLTRASIIVRSDLFQHRLWLPEPESDSAAHEWADVLIPFRDFTLTNSGDLAESQIEMLRTRVRTVGVSCLGPKEGRFELGIERIDAVNDPVPDPDQ